MTRAINGSFRNFVPDYYQSGFQMVTMALARYDPKIWNKAFNFTGEEPFTLNPVNISLRKSAGLTKKKLYKETFDTLKTIWSSEILNDGAVQYADVNPDKRGKYINYYSPVVAGTDSIIAIKTSLTTLPAFVLINLSDKTEETIHIPGQVYPRIITYGNGKLVWVEFQPDKRWENRDYSVIKLFDLRTNRTKRLSHNTRYLAAAISPDGKTICAIENTTANSNNLVFIDAETGTVQKSVPSPENSYLQRPQWGDGGKKITVINLTGQGEGIISYSLVNNVWETLVEPDKIDLQSSELRNDSLFYISSLSGTENVYIRTPGKKLSQLTRSRFGSNDLFLSGNKVYFSDYNSSGNSICSAKIATATENITAMDSASFLINRVNIKQQDHEKGVGDNYNPEPYRKWQHLFRFHSWMPFYADIQQIQSDPAFNKARALPAHPE